MTHHGSSNFIRKLFLSLYSEMKLGTIFNSELTSIFYKSPLPTELEVIGGMPGAFVAELLLS